MYGARRALAQRPTKRATYVISRDGLVTGIITSELRMRAHADRSLETAPPAPLAALLLRPSRLTFREPSAILNHMVNQWERLDLVFQALADPTRRGMVATLTRGPASVSELAGPLTMSMPAVLGHLRVLQDSGLVRSTKVGRVRTCAIDPRALTAAEQWFTDRRAAWERDLDRLGATAGRQTPNP